MRTASTPVNSSESLFEQANLYLPGGVNSPVRSFKAVGGYPLFIQSGKGAYLTDINGTTYLDYVGAWGAMILGHADPCVLEAITRNLTHGLCFGAPSFSEIELAKKIISCIPSVEKIRFTNSGTEATMTAIRLARGITRRNKIVKFSGCYHGHGDSLLVESGSGALTFNVPTSAGIPEEFVNHTLMASFNQLSDVEALFEKYPQEIAAVIIEPIAANMNLVLPLPDFLKGLRELCSYYGSLLIFDEVITGFRVHLGGAQQLYNIQPDLTTLGKIIGGGLPIGALGGRAEYLNQLTPTGPVYHAGTLAGHPLVMAAGLITLEKLSTPGFYESLTTRTQELATGTKALADANHIPTVVHHSCGLMGLFFTTQENVLSHRHAVSLNQKYFRLFFHALLKKHIYFPPSPFEALFLSGAHTARDIQVTLTAIQEVFETLPKPNA